MGLALKRNNDAEGDLVFAPGEEKKTGGNGAWKILIVDDEQEVHAVTELALRSFSFEGKSLHFYHAYTGAEALRIMADQPDIAVILLDVVMETDDAGLVVAKKVRTELHNRLVRIILRTGQAGMAPENDVIVKYEINDYKTKTELTAQKLFTALVGSLRNYRDLVMLDSDHRKTEDKLLASFTDGLRSYRKWIASEGNRRSLEKVVSGSGSWFEMPSMEQFIEGVASQTAAMLRVHQGAVFHRTAQTEAANAADAAAAKADAATPKTAAMAGDDFSEYEMTSRSEALSILRSLIELGSLVTFYFNQGYDFLLTSLREISPDGKTMIFDGGANPEVNRKLLQADKINGVSSKEKVKIQFILNGVKAVKHQGQDAFLCDVPDSLFRLQRREYYRLPVPLANPVKANIGMMQNDGSVRTTQAVVFDISGGGVCLVVAPGDDTLKVDAEFFGASINLPNTGLITFDFRVRNIYDITTSSGKILRRAGCEFIKLSGPMMKLIQRYIIQVERERSTHGA